MSKNVYANGMEVACKAGDGKVIASFPDVCLSPPSPPAGPIPVPYPDTSFSKDMQDGSKSVQIGGAEIMLKDQSFFQTSPLGDEAATKSFGSGVVSHVITGKTYFAAWSMDVKFEGLNVDRHLDLTTSNHASPMGNTPPLPETEDQAVGDKETDEDKCPCCGQSPHENQVDPDTKQMYKAIDEMDWYKKGVDAADSKVAGIESFFTNNPQFNRADASWQEKINNTLQQQQEAHDAFERLKSAREKTPPCENLHDPPNTGCGKHLDKTSPEPRTSDPKVRKRLGFTERVRKGTIRRDIDMGRPCPPNSSIIHQTPLGAGGCPNGPANLIPKDVLSDECKAVDDAQTALQTWIDRGKQ